MPRRPHRPSIRLPFPIPIRLPLPAALPPPPPGAIPVPIRVPVRRRPLGRGGRNTAPCVGETVRRPRPARPPGEPS